jgi:hypothetical protein
LQPRGESASGAADIRIRMAARAKAIVVHEKRAARIGQVAEKINERVAGHE